MKKELNIDESQYSDYGGGIVWASDELARTTVNMAAPGVPLVGDSIHKREVSKCEYCKRRKNLQRDTCESCGAPY